MKKKKLIKAIISLLLIILQIGGIGLVVYTLRLYKGVEDFYRYYAIGVLVYFLFFFSYLMLRGIKKKSISFIIPVVLILLILGVEGATYYYLTKVYKTIDTYSEVDSLYHSSLVTYNKELKDEKDLVNMKIGIVKDENDIEGNILPLEAVKELKLEDKNQIVFYDSTMELLFAVKTKEVDAAFFSSNYIDMFYTLEDFETIEEDTKVLYKISKEYESKEENIKRANASLDQPFSMLLIGVDSSADGVTSGYNADVLLLVTFNPNTLKATITSVPRDMYLKTACSSTYRRINTTTWGSSSTCAVQTIERMFDVDIDYYAKINFKGVVQLVEAVGGIDVEVPYSLCDQNSSRNWGGGGVTIYVKEGQQHLNGEQALALARNRHKAGDGSKAGDLMEDFCPEYTDGDRNDYTRGKNQMKVIMGIVEAGTKISDPNKVVEVLESIKSNFQTNITSKELLTLYDLAKSIIVDGNNNIVNVQRTQLSGYGMYGKIYEESSHSYPAVTIPYNGSINEIKEIIHANLNNTELDPIKSMSFDLNEPFEDTVYGQGRYSQSRIVTLKDVSSYSVDSIRSYASSNGLSLSFIDADTNQSVNNIKDWTDYYFHYQDEHPDIILSQVKSLTIYVKKRNPVTPTTTDPNKPAEGGDNTGGENTGGDNTGGQNTGGENTGGDNTGGQNAGGENTGGDNTGGQNTGGDNTGGDNTGGDNTGGDNTGGNSGGNDTPTPPTPDPTPEPTPDTPSEGE